MSNKISVGIYTLGCRVNQYESCVIAEMLKSRGIEVTKKADNDYYIVNTCAVTAESARKSRQLVRRCASKGKVIVIGCASQLDQSFADIENVIYVNGNREKTAVVKVICDNFKPSDTEVLPMDGAPYENMCLSEKDELFSECRAFIKIQDGCNGKCTYCIIPKCRGSVRSRPVEEVITEASNLAHSGYQEVILTGIEVGAYNKASLGELIKKVAEVDGIERIRLGSLSPNIISRKFLETVVSTPKFLPHIHLSIQSCCDRILQLMARPYRKADIYNKIQLIREYLPNCVISADIIVGFPGETDDEFLETVASLKELDIFHIHSFPYSERKGTKAAVMPESVPKHIRAARNTYLISECAETKNKILDSFCGKKLAVLIEKIVDGYAYGHSKEFIECRFESNGTTVGDIVDVTAICHNNFVLECKLF